MREHSSHFRLQPLGLYSVRSEMSQKTDTSSDYAMTFPAWWKSASFSAPLPPWKGDLQRQPSVRGSRCLEFTLKWSPPRLDLEMAPGLDLPAVRLHSDHIPRELVCQGLAWYTPMTSCSSWSGLNPSSSCHLLATGTLSVISLSGPQFAHMENGDQTASLLEWFFEFSDMLQVDGWPLAT